MKIKNFEQFNDDLIFEIIGYQKTKNYKTLNENINHDLYPFLYYKKDDRIYIKLEPFFTRKLKKIQIEVENILKLINNFIGKAIYNNHIIIYNYKIKLTEHYISKFIRVEIEDPKNERGMINPELDEGFKFLIKNSNELTKFILNKSNKGLFKNGKDVLIYAKDGEGIEIIFVLIKEKTKHYELILKSQIKGKVKFDKNKKETENLPI